MKQVVKEQLVTQAKKVHKQQRGFWSDFQAFINRGNVIDLAVGVVIGSAFTAIINSIVKDIMMPLISLVAGGFDFTKLAVDIPNFFGNGSSAHITYGNFIQNAVNFLIIAWAIFIFIRFFNKLQNRIKPKPEKADPAEIALLKEIRDELKKRKNR